jgi:hypothetical protein
MLRRQLVDAIGSVVTAEDFAKYMEYHKRHLFMPAYRPKPFSYPIRQLEHAPEGACWVWWVGGWGVVCPVRAAAELVSVATHVYHGLTAIERGRE